MNGNLRSRFPFRSPIFPTAGLCALLLACALAACGGDQTAEERARKVAEKISRSQPDVEATALAQPIDAEELKKVQQQLSYLKEYQGEVNGKLDSVTVNAIQAFQRSADLPDHGILDEKTREKLAASSRAAGP